MSVNQIVIYKLLLSSRWNDLMNSITRCFYVDIKIQQLSSSSIYKQNVSISLSLNDSVQCRRGYYI